MFIERRKNQELPKIWPSISLEINSIMLHDTDLWS